MEVNELTSFVSTVVFEVKKNERKRIPENSPYSDVFAVLDKYKKDEYVGVTMTKALQSLELDLGCAIARMSDNQYRLQKLLFNERIVDGLILSDTKARLLLSHIPAVIVPGFNFSVELYNILLRETNDGILDFVSVIERAEAKKVPRLGPKNLEHLKEVLTRVTGVVFK